MPSSAKPIVECRIISLTGLLLLLMVIIGCEADEEKLRKVSDAVWIAATASGCALFGVAVITLFISTTFIRRYERTRLQQVLAMAPIITSVPIERTEPGSGPATSPLSLFVSPLAGQGQLSPSDADLRTAGHVYYNRAMDIDEGPEVERTSFAHDPMTLNLDENRRVSMDITVC